MKMDILTLLILLVQVGVLIFTLWAASRIWKIIKYADRFSNPVAKRNALITWSFIFAFSLGFLFIGVCYLVPLLKLQQLAWSTGSR